MKKTPDYDNVFKTMKTKHKRLFIPVINDIFGKSYPIHAKAETLPSEGYLTENETADGRKEIEAQISDFLMKIEDELYLLECQSYDDGSMAVRIAEYAFITAKQFALWDIGHATIRMPRFAVIYIKRTDKTPKTTQITFIFPDDQKINYESDNVILEEFTRESIVGKRLFPYIPFYIARYEREIVSGSNIDDVMKDLTYFRDAMVGLHQKKELVDDELIDLMGFVNTIIVHITDGNEYEERLVNIMGGTVIETASEKLIDWGRSQGISLGISQGMLQGQAKMIIELNQEEGIDDAVILKQMKEKLSLSEKEAAAFLKQYGK